MRSPGRTLSGAQTTAKLFLAVTLTFALLAGVAPLEGGSASASTCRMPCCKGKRADSGHCSGGSCHIKFSAQPTQRERDPLCGASLVKSSFDPTKISPHTRHDAHDATGAHDELEHHGPRGIPTRNTHGLKAVFTARSLSRPCPEDCGAGAGFSTQIRRPRHEASLTHALRPRPPTAATLARRTPDHVRTPEAARGPTPPRGPPSLLS
ncbi:MAG TPA: hypothetical protein VER08_00230 [Pyrinomonadaceae bacterium]|nr:hypothetical protein [Pyrinomonadaceae bacterium]